MTEIAGRSCPVRYRYGAEAIAQAPTCEVETLYVVGGLYGNLPALDAIEAMAKAETGPVSIVFNGDFNWFNVDDADFAEINRRVARHAAILGNVEAELGHEGDAAGCGCAYPEHVDHMVVERSNQIHAQLKTTAARHPQILEQLARLPMFARFSVGGCVVGIVHGDADSLAGWRFDASALSDPANQAWLANALKRAEVDIFASTHTCLPALRQIGEPSAGLIINNGAAGMPNFRQQLSGLLTRISVRPPCAPIAYGITHRGVHIDALAVAYDTAEWQANFLANWPEGSAAWLSYYQRISQGPAYELAQAV